MSESVFKIVFVAGFVAGRVIRRISTRRATWGRRAEAKRPTERRGIRLEWLLLILVSVGMFFLPLVYLATGWLSFADFRLPDWLGWLGATVFVAALWLLWRSHADLGRHWSMRLQIQEGHSLVTTGVYRYLRHPMYAAHWLWAIAQALLLHNWIAGPAFLVTFLPLYLRRVPREEQMMLDHFGEEYRQYVGRTGRLIPRLGRR